MEFFKQLNPKQQKWLKISGLVVIGIVVLSVLSNMGAPYGPTVYRGGVGMSEPRASYDYAVGENASFAGKGVALSTRNVMPVPPSYGGTTGSDAESFEVSDYYASIETGNLARTCDAITALKSKDYVIFENSSAYDRGCNHVFKVKKANVPEVLTVIKGLDPKELTENTHTIKNQVDDFTSETEILQKKLKAIDDTLAGAMRAYDEITAIATRANDAGSLAKIIDSKVQIIERLTQERINISMQLDRYARAKAQELDKLEYTYFSVNVWENRYVDGDNIKDSWKEAVRQFFFDLNRIIQDLTLGIIGFILVIAQILIYAFIVVFVAKYAWRGIKNVWKR
jgi:hypothetical protein